MEIINTYQKKILDFTGEGYNRTEALIKNINIDRDMTNLIIDLKGLEKPEEEIPYAHYPTEIDFNKCCDGRDFKVCNEIVKTIRTGFLWESTAKKIIKDIEGEKHEN